MRDEKDIDVLFSHQLISEMTPTTVWTVKEGAVEQVELDRHLATGMQRTPPTQRRLTSSRVKTPCTPTPAKHLWTPRTGHTLHYPVHKIVNLLNILLIPRNILFIQQMSHWLILAWTALFHVQKLW